MQANFFSYPEKSLTLLKTLRLSGIYLNQKLLHLQLLVAVANVRGGHTGSEKKTAWWNQEVKKAIRAKKSTFRAWSTNKSSEQLRLRHFAEHKTAATIVKQSNEKLCEEFGQKLDTDYRSANTVFFKPYAGCAANEHQLPPSSRMLITCF